LKSFKKNWTIAKIKYWLKTPAFKTTKTGWKARNKKLVV